MAKLLMLLVFLAHLLGCDAEFTMTQPPSLSASIGDTVKISCRRSTESVDDYFNSWYQQKPNSAPKLLIYGDELRESGIPDRFSGSLDSSANSAILTISSLQADDEADYYCLSYDSSEQHTVTQPHREVRQKPPCRRWASFGLDGS
uniref:Ig-like domain-containing protein n=1 Tax=Podarcis muralis TaxID=64176 RepID=A0A670JX65_PODMU